MKLVKTSLVLFGLVVAACGQNQESKKETVYAEDAVPADLQSKVPTYMIMKVDQETGAVTTAVTSEAMPQIDTTSEAGRVAFAKAEAEIFSRAKQVNVLEGDASEAEGSTESFWVAGGAGRCGARGFGFGFGVNNCAPVMAVGVSTFNYGYIGGAAYSGCGFYRFGVASYNACGVGACGFNSGCGMVGGCGSAVPYAAYNSGFNNGYGYGYNNGYGNGYGNGYTNGFADGSMMTNPGYGPYVTGTNPGMYPYN